MSSIALKIFLKDWVERIFCLKTLCWAPVSSSFRRYGTGSTLLPNDLLLLDIVRRRGGGVFAAGLRPALIRADEVLRELVERVLQLFGSIVVELEGLTDGGEDAGLAFDVIVQFGLEAQHIVDRDVVEVAVGAGIDRHGLLLERPRGVLTLFEQFGQACAASQIALGRIVEVRGEHREGLERAVLSQRDLQRTGDALECLGLCGAADTRDGHTHVDSGTLTGVEEVRLEEDLTVGDRDHVGRNERSDVIGLGFDDRQTGHRAAAELVGELRTAFEQTRVEVEHVTRVGLTARRTTQEQRHGAVGFGLLRQIVEDDEDVLAVVHPVLTDGRAGVGCEVLESGRIRRRRGHDGRVLESSCLFQRTTHAGDGRALLADSDVDAADLLLRVAGLPVGLLVDDRVDRQSGLAGLAVTDDQLTLSTAARNHRVDALVAGLEGLAHLLPVHHACGLELELTAADGLDVAESVDGTTQRIDDTTEVSIADRDRQDLAGAVDVLFFSDRGELAEDDDADLPFVEVL